MLEAIALCEEITGKPLNCDLLRGQSHAAITSGGSATSPNFKLTIPIGNSPTTSRDIIREIYEHNCDRWLQAVSP